MYHANANQNFFKLLTSEHIISSVLFWGLKHLKAYKLKIHGRVQGVGFRYYTEIEANRHGITGWVRNCADGSVEALICGDETQTKAMLSWLKHGPVAASVNKIDIEQTSISHIPNHFKVTR